PDLRELLGRLGRLSSRLKVTFFDAEREPERNRVLIRQHGLTNDDVLRGGVVVVKSGESKKYLPADELSEYAMGEGGPRDRRLKAFKGEQAILSAILTVSQGEKAEICATSEHEEGDLDSFDGKSGYSAFHEALKRDNHQTRKLKDLDKGVPKTCSA